MCVCVCVCVGTFAVTVDHPYIYIYNPPVFIWHLTSCTTIIPPFFSIHQPISCIHNPSIIPPNLGQAVGCPGKNSTKFHKYHTMLYQSIRHSIKKVYQNVQFSMILVEPMVCSRNWWFPLADGVRVQLFCSSCGNNQQDGAHDFLGI